LKTNTKLRRDVFASINSIITGAQDADYYQSEEAYDVGLFLPFNEAVFTRATLTALPSPTTAEDASLRCGPAPMMEEEINEGRFHKEPLDVGNGVAVLEESVGLGVPDVVAQK
jgi:hypothetical protein